MQTFGVTNKEYYGMSWYFLEWSITNCERQSGIVGNNVKHVAGGGRQQYVERRG